MDRLSEIFVFLSEDLRFDFSYRKILGERLSEQEEIALDSLSKVFTDNDPEGRRLPDDVRQLIDQILDNR